MPLQTDPHPFFARGLRLALAALLLPGIASTALAQQASAPPKKAEDEAVALSPFIVDASKDQGYRATNTLAGSRINTPLKDVAQSITVVTKEFLNDVAAVDINDILSYTANTEGTRDFTATVPTLGRPSDDVARNPQTANRLRGLNSADITRDYFFTIGTWVGFDTYNLDQVTINRGPNSVLAGLGSPAGIINYSPVLAGLNRNSNEASYRIGSFTDQRATLNSNIVARKNVLAFRLAAAWADKGFKQQPAWNEDNRWYVTTTYKPWSKTTVRAAYEVVKIESNQPNSLTPEDDVSQWIALGRPSYDRNSTTPVSTLLWQDGNLATVVYDKNGKLEGAFNTNTGYYFNDQNLSSVGIWQPVRMSSNRYLQLNKLNMSPSLADLKLETKTFSIDQEIVRNLNANISYIHEEVDNERLDLFRPEYQNYLIDVNLRTPTGATNPHYGETFMQFRGLDNKQTAHETNEVARATVTYELDLNKHNKWLGRYRLVGFGERRETERQRVQYNAKRSDRASYAYLAETRARYYLGGTAATMATTVPGHPGLVSAVPNTFLNTVTGNFEQDQLNNFYALKSDNKDLVKLDSTAVVLQGYLWGDRIVGMFGLRRDANKAGFISSVEGGPDAFAITGVHSGTNPATGLIYPAGSNYGVLSTKAQNTKTYSVVVHPLKWLSVHYNRAENFVPNAGAVDLLGSPVTTPTGVGKDMGFSVSLLEEKLNIKMNWFELAAEGGPAGNPANFPLAQWNMTFMDLVIGPQLAAEAGIAYKPAVASGIIVGDPRLANAYTADNVSKGLELELTYNVTKNWRMMANVSKQEAKQTNIASALTAFVEERLAYWRSVPALWTTRVTTSSGNPWGLTQTGEQHFNQFLLGSYVGYRSVDGKPSTQLRKWRGNVVSNYTISEGALKGVNFGGAARYMEKSVIGNPAITNSAGVVTGLDLARPYTSKSYVGLDAWVGYRRKIFGDKYGLDFQVNVRDIDQGSGGFRPIGANSDGNHSVYRIVQPCAWYFTTKLEF